MLQMNKKIKLVLALVFTTILLVSLFSFLGIQPGKTTTIPSYGQYKALVTVIHEREGNILSYETTKNKLVQTGRDWIEQTLANDSNPLVFFDTTEFYKNQTFTYIALSNDATAVTESDTNIASEIVANNLTRTNNVTYNSIGYGNWSIETFWIASGTQAVQKSGIFNNRSASGGVMLAAATFTSASLISGDKLTVRWNITISEA